MTLHWTDDEPAARRSTGGMTLAQSKAAMLSDTPGNPLVPPVTATVLVTLFFGVFGLIPAMIHSDRARSLGEPTAKYWQAFAVVMVVSVVVWLLILV